MEFVHPWFMAAGGALVSSPIIIHLINRMRFRRIRWAAMEFLLKSQKRNRRRLIIEQLILLLLRILLVLLAAFLVARFIYAGLSGDKSVTHLVFLDDSLSMADRGPEGQAFDAARKEIVELARNAMQSPRQPQKMQVRLLSQPDTSIFDERLSELTVDQLSGVLAQHKPTQLAGRPLVAFEKAQNVLNEVPTGQKIFHFVSDFRDVDWVSGPDVEPLHEVINTLSDGQINISLIDVADPNRGSTRQVVRYHNNLALTDLRAESRMAAENVPMEFTATVHNFGDSTTSTFLTVKLDGEEEAGAIQPVSDIPAGQSKKVKFSLLFTKTADTAEIKAGDNLEVRDSKRRQEREFRQVTAEITAEEVGLNDDNVIDMVVEVRRKVPSLIVSGSGPESRLPGGGVFHLLIAFFSARAFDVEVRTLEELARTDLNLYPSIFLLNVSKLDVGNPEENEKLIKKLDDYVLNGGSIAYFMGEKATPPFYNEQLFRKHKGLFPVLIEDRPTDPLDPRGTLTPEQRRTRRNEEIKFNRQPKIVWVEKYKDHPIISTLYKYRSIFYILPIDRYFQTLPRGEWDPRGRAEIVATLPNNSSIDDYKPSVRAITREAVEKTEELVAKENKNKEDKQAKGKWSQYLEPVEEYRKRIRNVMARPNSYLFDLAQEIEHFLYDPAVKGDNPRPDMPTLWAQPSMKGLKTRLVSVLDRIKTGDPLIVANKHGRGRVVVVLTSAGTEWNQWASGTPLQWSFPVFLMDLQRYLVSEGADLNRKVGDEINLTFPATRYKTQVTQNFRPQEAPKQDGEGGNANTRRPALEKLPPQTMPINKELATFLFDDTDKPGIYYFAFEPQTADVGKKLPETRAYAFNVDTKESDLKRAPRDKLERKKSDEEGELGAVVLRSPGDDYTEFKRRDPDVSESPWLYLIILLILVAEQAMAVHLSFHLKGDDSSAAAPARPGLVPAS